MTYRRIAVREPVPTGIGETITKTRKALLPPVLADQNPAANTGLDNGLSPTNIFFEQFQVGIGLTANTIDLNLEQEETLIGPLYQENWETLGQQAAASLDIRIAQELHTRYGGGDTYVNTAATTSTTIAVDNIYGFINAFPVSVFQPSAGLAIAVSPANKLAVTIYPANGSAATTANVVATTPDPVNASSMLVGAAAFGASGVLTLDKSVTVAVGDRVVAFDGSVVLRPNGKTTRLSLTNTDVVTLQLFINARQKLKMRAVPTMSNGCYAVICDSVVMGQLFNDPQFVRATQGTFDNSPVFKNGVVAKALGLEFVESQYIPIYRGNATLASQGLYARRAIVIGQGAIVDAPFEGALVAAKKAKSGLSISDIRVVNDIVMVTRPSMDRMAQVVSQTWKYTGGRSVPTDFLSNALVIPSSDSARYKRACEIEVVG